MSLDLTKDQRSYQRSKRQCDVHCDSQLRRYVEDNITARLYRQAPLNSIWEGSGNVQCIDILRAMTTHKESLPAFFARVRRARGSSAEFDVFASQVESRASQIARRVAAGDDESRNARALADDMAVCLQVTFATANTQLLIQSSFAL